MEKCPFCHSKNTAIVGNQFQNQIPYHYRIIQGNNSDESCFTLLLPEYFCLDCGMVFKKVPEKNLADYKKMKPYFTENK